MTVAAEIPLALYDGDGVTVAFPAPWRYLDVAHLKVEVISAAGVATVKVLGTHYTATAGLTDSGGTVTMLAAPASGETVRVRRVTPLAQTAAYPTSGNFPARSHELALDRQAMAHQETRRELDDAQARALQVPFGETALPLASLAGAEGKVLGVVSGKVQPVANSGAEAAQYADDAQTAKLETQLVKTEVEAIADDVALALDGATGAETGAVISAGNAALSAAAAQAWSAGALFADTAVPLTNGVLGLAMTANGSGGTDGTFTGTFTGGGGTGAQFRFVVASGAVVPASVVITNKGSGYTSTPTPVFTASAGLTGPTATVTIGPLTSPGDYLLVTGASGIYATLYRNVAGVITSQGLEMPTKALIDTVQATAVALAPQADRASRLTDTALDGFELISHVLGANNESVAYARWAKFFDASSANSDTTIAVGTVVDAVTLEAATLAAAGNKVHCRVWQRALTSASLNAAPGAAGDVLVSDTGLIDVPTTWTNLTGLTTPAYPFLPVPSFTVMAGFTYGFEWWWEDGSGNLLGTIVRRKTMASAAQRLAGFYYATAGAGAWTNQTTTRTVAFGFGRRKVKDVAVIERTAQQKVAATPFTSNLTEMERTMLVERGAWDRIRRPMMPTKNHGLARLGFHGGVLGVDFGPRVLESAMSDMKANANWNGTDRVNLAGLNVNDPGGYVIEKALLSGGYIQMPTQCKVPVAVRDCVVRNSYTVGTGINQPTNDTLLTIEHSLFEQHSTMSLALKRAVVRNSILQSNGQNATTILHEAGMTTGYARFEGCFFGYSGDMAAGLADPHGDLLEANYCWGLSVCASTFWLPYDGATGADPSDTVNFPYWERTKNQVNCVRHSVASAGATVAESYVLGCVFGGSNPAMTIRPRYNGSVVRNVMRANSRYAGSGYRSSIPPIRLRGAESGVGIWKNVSIFDEYFFDGTPVDFSTGEAVPASYLTRIASPNPYRPHEERWGVWDWDKAVATPAKKEMLHVFGKATGREILNATDDLNPAYDLGNLITFTGTAGGAD